MPGTAPGERPLWTCRKCARQFANRNQTHTCGLHDLDDHFRRKAEHIRGIFEAFAAILRSFGPVRVLPEKTRIAFQVRMSFAQLTPRRQWVDGHLVLARRVENRCFTRIETFSPKNHLHAFRLASTEALDAAFVLLMREAYAVGEQRHLVTRSR